MSYACEVCEKTFADKSNLNRHRKIHEGSLYACKSCSKTFGRKDNLKRHETNCKKGERKKICKDDEGGSEMKDEELLEKVKELEEEFEFDLERREDRRCRNLGVHRQTFEARLRQRGGGKERVCLPGQLEAALHRAIVDRIVPEARPDDDLWVYIGSNRLRSAYNSQRATVGEWQQGGGRAGEILRQLERMLNSNENFSIDDSFQLQITHAKDPGKGKGRKKLGLESVEDLLKGKKSVIRIENDDDLCCARALVVVKAHRDKHEKYDQIRKGRAIQGVLARDLHAKAGVTEGACGLEEVQKFQDYLTDYQIVALSVDHAGQIIFKGSEKPEEKRLILLKTGEHYHSCTSISAFFGGGGYCLRCEKSFHHNTIASHRCKGRKCSACFQSACADFKKGGKVVSTCGECFRWFYGQECLKNHKMYKETDGALAKEESKSVCGTKRKCGKCQRFLQEEELRKGHTCNTSKCPCCKKWVKGEHKCYIQKSGKKRKREEEETIFVDWDSETMQGDGIHSVNLICAQSTHAPESKFEWYGEKSVKEFVDFVISLSKSNKIIAVAHNAKGFDHYPIVDELYRRQRTDFKQIVVGGKILSISVGQRLQFKDSLCFLPMPLSAFPKAFGIKEEVKGFFPHFFNVTENQHYVGPLPAVDYYDPEGMSVDRKKVFEEWYRQEKESGRPFDFQVELKKYCHSDVALLKAGRETFCQEFMKVAGFDPFEQCITIASACNLFYRRSYIPLNKIASEPATGWHGQRKPYSDVSLRWMKTLPNFLDIRHARNGGEMVICCPDGSKIYPDGMDETRRVAYQFYGCYFHGCPCFSEDRHIIQSRLGGVSLQERYDDTVRQEEELKRQGYKVVTKWQCKFEEQGPIDPIEKPLEPRQAFYGGRTNVVKLYHRVQEEEKEEIRYVDFTSLYPWVNKYGEYPVGHPEIIFDPDTTSISQYFGLAKVTILPPIDLFHAVLPYRTEKGKLLFPLCRSCALLCSTDPCQHTEEAERSLTATWCTPEIEEAIKRGYTITKIHEVWHFRKRSPALFKKYVDTFLKMKQEASGWPAWVGDDWENRAQYVREYLEHEGVQLESSQIQKNPGKRSLAKLMLNSFWGKFGQQNNKTQVKVCYRPTDLYPLLRDSTKDVRMLRVVTDEAVEVIYKNVADADPVQVKINIFVAAFTTCYARLKLYREGIAPLDPSQVLYFDTDSIIYSHKPGQPELPLGDYLGQFTNELDAGDYITEFASAGPKNYGYVTRAGKVECKVRGFTLNSRGKEQLNFNVLRDNIVEEIMQPREKAREIPVFNPHKIVRDPEEKKLYTQTEIKRYRMVTDKRVLDPETYMTYPYGWRAVGGVEVA